MTDKETCIVRYIKAYEKLRDKLIYPIKTPLDDINCPICGGKYKRRDKSKHAKRKKHGVMMKEILKGKLMPIIEWDDVIEVSEEEE